MSSGERERESARESEGEAAGGNMYTPLVPFNRRTFYSRLE
jgi:hypothetical protein